MTSGNKLSEHEVLIGLHLKELGLFDYVREYRFCPQRKWRFDVAVKRLHLAIEIEGGIWTQGRHTRGAGAQADMDKYNEAIVLGWRVFRFSVADVLKGRAKEYLHVWLDARKVNLWM